MPTLRERAASALKERLGFEVMPVREATHLREAFDEFRAFVDDAEELGWYAMDYLSGRPQEMAPERRKRLAQKSRYAMVNDPLLKAEAGHLGNFSLGRGISTPDCAADEVQKIVDEAWSDPVNQEVALSYEAQRKLSNDLLASANLYPCAYVSAGKVRLGMIPPDRVERIVTDPENDNRALWYLARESRVEWDYKTDQAKLNTDGIRDGLPKLVYWPHWRNVEDAEREGMTFPGLDTYKVGPGLVYHIRINRVGETQFGTPPWAASLRFASAMNEFLESRVIMAKASAQFIAKRIRKDSPEGLIKAARSVTNVAGELARTNLLSDPGHWGGDPRAQEVGPGAWWVENEADRLESLKMDSGAAQAAQDVQIIRSPLAAASFFGQHYLGDASATTLAGGVTLELPTLMAVGAWQETIEQFVRWFVDLVIQEAVRSGRLGGANTAEGGPPLSEVYLSEADGRAEMQKRTGLDLSYSFQMPYPGRRNLPDVTTAITSVFTAVPGLERNEPWLLEAFAFMFNHGWELEDPTGKAELIVEAQKKLWKEADKAAAEQANAAGQGGGPSGVGNEGQNPPGDQQSQQGEKRQTQPPNREMGQQQAEVEPYLDPGLAVVGADLARDIEQLYVSVPASAGLNGDGA